MKKLLIAVPTFENIHPETFKSIFDLEKIPGVNLGFEFVKGYDCARARNKIIDLAVDQGYDHVLMVDSDIILPKDTLTLMHKYRSYAVVMGYCPRKDDPEVTEIYKQSEDGYSKDNRYLVKELESCDYLDLIKINGGAFGCVMIHMAIIPHIEYPYFEYESHSDRTILSEDLYFCNKVKARGHDIHVSPKIKCQHIGQKIV